MKTLEPEADKSFVLFRPARLLAVAGIFASVAVFFLAAWLSRWPEQLVMAQSLQAASGIVGLAAEIAARPAQQTRNTLSLIAKNPELRQIGNASAVLAWQQRIQTDISLLFESYEPFFGHVYDRILAFSHDIEYYSEIPSALMRRLAVVAGIEFPDSDQNDPTNMWRPSELTGDDLRRMSVQTGLVREKMTAVRRLAAESCNTWISMALVLEKLAGYGQQSLRDVAAVEDYFSAVLNDEMLRAIMLRSLDGKVLALVGDMPFTTMNLDTRDCRAIISGSIFFSGPVGYDSRRRHSIWWVAVPVRDENRNPIACLTAFVDADFLSQAAEKAAEHTDIRLMFSDRSGVVIGHADREVVARQVNMSNVLPSFVNETDRGFTSRFVRYDGKLLLQAGRSVRHGNVRHLPDWYVCYEQNLSGFARQSQFLLTLSVILLAATGMYALSCCVVRLF